MSYQIKKILNTEIQHSEQATSETSTNKSISIFSDDEDFGKKQVLRDTIQIYSYKTNRITYHSSDNKNFVLANEIYNQIRGFSLAKNTKKVLSKINSDNIIDIISNYSKLSPEEDLITALYNEWGLSNQVVSEHIIKPLLEKADLLNIKNLGNQPNINNIEETIDFIAKAINKIQNKEFEVTYPNMQAVPIQLDTEENIINDIDVENVSKKFNPNDYSIKSLKKRFPNNEVRPNGEYGILVKGKEDDEIELLVEKDLENDSILIIKPRHYSIRYDKNGDLLQINKFSNSEQASYYYDKGKMFATNINGQIRHFLTEDISNEINKRKQGIPTKGDKLPKYISEINYKNILDVLQNYVDINDKNLTNDIWQKINFSKEDRLKFIIHIKNALIEKLKQDGKPYQDLDSKFNEKLNIELRKIGFIDINEINYYLDRMISRARQNKVPEMSQNGKIDVNFSQGETGDCWILAGIEALKHNPTTNKILNNLIKSDLAGNVEVSLPGVNRKYLIYKEELDGMTELSNGDVDVRALEIAISKYYEETDNRNINDGGISTELFKLVLNKESKSYNQTEFFKDKSLLQKISQHKAIGCAARIDKAKSIQNDPNNGGIYTSHEYAIVNADNEFIYLINPHDTSKTIKMTYYDFKKIFNDITYLEI